MLPVGADATPHGAGGRLCLAMVNTVLWRRSGEPIERIETYADLATFVARAGWLYPDVLIAQAQAHPRKANLALDRAIRLRESLYDVFSDVAAGRQPADLDGLNSSLAEAMQQTELVAEPHGVRLRWRNPVDLDLPRWQMAASASAVLTSADVERLKQCPGESCGWVFIDESRNQSRRWCDSRECGNRERVRAHYRRTHAESV
jgi:predicted RNA-binding Zn ribbon-like protein